MPILENHIDCFCLVDVPDPIIAALPCLELLYLVLEVSICSFLGLEEHFRFGRHKLMVFHELLEALNDRRYLSF